VVDSDLNLYQMIELGKYDYSFNVGFHDHWEGRLQQVGHVEADLFLFKMKQTCSESEVRHRIDKEGLEPVKLEYLLAFGADYPDIQRKFTVVALGSYRVDHYGTKAYPYLFSGGVKHHIRTLDLRNTHQYEQWGSTWRFLVVRKAK